MFRVLVSRLRLVNIFPSPITAKNEYELQNERISTRLFIVILSLLIVLSLIYTAQVKISERIEVPQLLYNEFQRLTLLHSQTLQCSCDNVAIPHESFLILKPEFHQLCSSDLIKDEWIDRTSLSSGRYVSDDFSYTASRFFLTLSSLCRLSNQTVTNALKTFKSTQLITSQVLSENVFVERIKTIIETFQSLTELNFYQSFDLIRYSIQTNSFLSGLFSNVVVSINLDTYFVSSLARLYENNTCNCDITSSCVDPLTLGNFTIPGLFKGCLLVEAVRQSTLECFYQSSCLSTIEQLLNIPSTENKSISPLNISMKSRFNLSSTIDQLLAKAMTEEWIMNISHAQYFDQCQVSLCTYSVTSRFNLLYIITTLIGLIGGLTKVLRILIPPIVKFIRRRFVSPPPVLNDIRK